MKELLQIENDPAFLEFRCAKTAYLLWPLIRIQFFRQLISDLFYKHASLLAPVSVVPYKSILSVLTKSVFHNTCRQHGQSEILVFATGAGQFKRQGVWFNRITDYLVEASFRDVATVEGIVDWKFPEPRWNKKVNYWLPRNMLILLSGRMCSRMEHARQAREVLEYARARAFSLCGLSMSDQCVEMLVGVMSRKIARLSIMQSAYRRVLGRVKPRLLILEEGCYSDHGVLNSVAREMGVRVAEPQHGMISAGHDAYNYSSLLCNSEQYREYLPHDFLGYGRWWNDQINVPVEKWVIGNPHYSEQVRSLKRGAGNKNILILSDGIEFSLYLTLAEELSSLLLGRYTVVLRPHPLERLQVHERFPGGLAGNVVIDRHQDIYESFAGSYAVAGEVSTGLFEAMGIVEKVFLWDTEKARFAYPVHPFFAFSNAQEFASAILSPEEGRLSVTQEDIWATDWKGNFQSYLEHVLV
ncbi:hypothetical protein [Pseudomonas asplenii]|uniref:hypothetical protein n=1 Tax=Pseudomonas asplenii TaxID=53407 RepID=UPI0006CD8FB3|nr:hypothetical protein [Pseudomonas fuscovaginae]KPA96678.1 hypothetical protein PF70_03217 [Pseudomonas fuscovaginae]